MSSADPVETRAALIRLVRLRWPRETLLAVEPCVAERRPDGAASGTSGGEPWEVPDGIGSDADPGVLGITESRVLYRGRHRQDASLRIATLVLATLAVAGALAGELAIAVSGFVLAGVVLVIRRVVDVYGIGDETFQLDRLTGLDRDRSQIAGTDRWGNTVRIRLEPSSFERVVPLLSHPA